MDQLSLAGFILVVTVLSVFLVCLSIFAGYKLWKSAWIHPSELDLDIGHSLYYLPRIGPTTPEGIRSMSTHVHHHVHVHERASSVQLPSYSQVTTHNEDYPKPIELLEVMTLETPPPLYEDVDQRIQYHLNYI